MTGRPKKKRSGMLRSQSPKRFYFGLLGLFPLILAGQFVETISTLVTFSAGSPDELLDWPPPADDGLVLPAFAPPLDCCDP
jgi:hypothetical protein